MTSKILVGGEEISKFEMNTDDLKNPGYIKMWVRYLGQEDLLEKGMATHSRILAWRISWTEEPSGLQSTGSQRVGQD